MAEKKTGLNCPITGNSLIMILIMTAVGMIYFFGYNLFIHGHILKPTYDLTPQMWRTAAEMQDHFLFFQAVNGLIAFAAADIYGRFANTKGIGEGVRFGILFGLVLGAQQVAPYAWLPISWELAQAWFLTGFGQGLGLGILYGLIWRPRS